MYYTMEGFRFLSDLQPKAMFGDPVSLALWKIAAIIHTQVSGPALADLSTVEVRGCRD